MHSPARSPSGQIGIIGAISPWLGTPASFLWGALADYTHSHRALMVFLLLSSNAVRLLLPASSSFLACLFIIATFNILSAPITVMVRHTVGGWVGGLR